MSIYIVVVHDSKRCARWSDIRRGYDHGADAVRPFVSRKVWR